jgi:hypothetical protein
MNLPYLSLPLNGDPLDTEALDRFAYDIHQTHARGLGRTFSGRGAQPLVPAHAGQQPLVPLRRSREGAAIATVSSLS